jgi:hypothetical protein
MEHVVLTNLRIDELMSNGSYVDDLNLSMNLVHFLLRVYAQLDLCCHVDDMVMVFHVQGNVFDKHLKAVTRLRKRH